MTKINADSKTRRFLCFVMALIVVFAAAMSYLPTTASAEETLEDLKDRYNEIEQNIQKNEEALADVQSEIKTNEKKLEQINAQIDDIESQISILNDRIGVLNKDINSLKSDISAKEKTIAAINKTIAENEVLIAETENTIEETRELLLLRLREHYMSGDGSTIEIILGSQDVSGFLARKELVARVSEQDNQTINDLTAKVTELAQIQSDLDKKKTELEEQKAQLDDRMDTLNERQEDLESSKSVQTQKKSEASEKKYEVRGIINDLDKDSAAYKKQIKRDEKELEEASRAIDEYIRTHGSSQGDTPKEEYENDGKMCWPVPGGNTEITARYPAYSDGSYHGGIDIRVVGADGSNISNGHDIVAAQGGEVIIAMNNGEWNGGFGNYCVIDHGDGTQTLYAHCKRLVVSKGQVVKKGQKIAEIGLTGNTTGYHLHFEVRVKQSDGSVARVDPLKYVLKP